MTGLAWMLLLSVVIASSVGATAGPTSDSAAPPVGDGEPPVEATELQDPWNAELAAAAASEDNVAAADPVPDEEHIKFYEELARHGSPEFPCDTPFGTVLGVANGVTAYSNCNSHHTSYEDHRMDFAEVTNGIGTVFAGMKWQCVEYARRYLMMKFNGLQFDDVGGADDIWRLTSVHHYGDYEHRTHLGRYRSFDAETVPAVHSLVIYPIQKDMPWGHVAVVVDVVPDVKRHQLTPQQREALPEGVTVLAIARLAEQNFDSFVWKNSSFRREVIVVMNLGGFIGLIDPAGYRPVGWMSVEPEILPLEFLHHPDHEEATVPIPIGSDHVRHVPEVVERYRSELEEAALMEASEAAKAELANQSPPPTPGPTDEF